MLIIGFSVLNIFITSRCNLKCSYCFLNKDNAPRQNLDIGELKKGVDFFLRNSGTQRTIVFTGGEPLLEFSKIEVLCSHIRRRGRGVSFPKIVLVTNGTFLNRRNYGFLKKNGIELKISIDGGKLAHDKNRLFEPPRHSSTYKLIKKNIKVALYGAGNVNRPGASLVFTPETVGSLLANIKALWLMGFRRIDFYPSLYAWWRSGDVDKLRSSMRDLEDFCVSTFSHGPKRQGHFENSLLYDLINEKVLYKHDLCNKAHLCWDGNFYLCDKALSLPWPLRKEFVIGNINEGIDNKLRSALLEQARQDIRKITRNACFLCVYAKYCFCPIGHYIYFSRQGPGFKRYFPVFCSISRTYIDGFLNIKRRLADLPPSKN